MSIECRPMMNSDKYVIGVIGQKVIPDMRRAFP